jgi:hypothetical protein
MICVIQTTATIVSSLESTATIINSGISDSICPIIINIDGGNANTISYPPVNGLLLGGTA